MTLQRTPIDDVPLGRLKESRSASWCFSLACYEETIQKLEELSRHYPQTPAIVHNHEHGQVCNDRCVLVEDIPELEEAPG